MRKTLWITAFLVGITLAAASDYAFSAERSASSPAVQAISKPGARQSILDLLWWIRRIGGHIMLGAEDIR
jgi:hypothetical protein